MSYFSTPYKFGKKTKAEIDTIDTSVLEVGDNVYNTDLLKEEFWTGHQWINDDCIQMTNSSTATISVGRIVGFNLISSPTASVVLSNTGTRENIVGVVYRGGSANSKMTVACTGYYKAFLTTAATSVTRQHIAQISTVTAASGSFASTGAKTIADNGTVGIIAETVTTIPADRLINIWIGVENY